MTPPIRTNRDIQLREWTPESMTPSQAVVAWIATVLRVANYIQAGILAGRGMVESNPILGPHPSFIWRLTYLIATLLLLWGVALLLRGKWRMAWLAGYGLVEVWSIACSAGWVLCWVQLFRG